jgi:hypothetical protein
MKRSLLLTAALLMVAAQVFAATSGTSIDQPITFFGNLIHGPIANLAFLGGSAAAIYSYHHDGFSRGFLSAAGAMVSGAYLGGIQNIGTLVGLTGALIHVIH